MSDIQPITNNKSITSADIPAVAVVHEAFALAAVATAEAASAVHTQLQAQ